MSPLQPESDFVVQEFQDEAPIATELDLNAVYSPEPTQRSTLTSRSPANRKRPLSPFNYRDFTLMYKRIPTKQECRNYGLVAPAQTNLDLPVLRDVNPCINFTRATSQEKACFPNPDDWAISSDSEQFDQDMDLDDDDDCYIVENHEHVHQQQQQQRQQPPSPPAMARRLGPRSTRE
jgi:hypothetical protein